MSLGRSPPFLFFLPLVPSLLLPSSYSALPPPSLGYFGALPRDTPFLVYHSAPSTVALIHLNVYFHLFSFTLPPPTQTTTSSFPPPRPLAPSLSRSLRSLALWPRSIQVLTCRLTVSLRADAAAPLHIAAGVEAYWRRAHTRTHRDIHTHVCLLCHASGYNTLTPLLAICGGSVWRAKKDEWPPGYQ